MGIEYLAFYQPKDKSKSTNNFDSDYGIEYYAKIKDYYEYERKDCTELKCNTQKENEIYIRIELDEFEKLSPIKRVEYGIRTINYTTLYLLKNANTMHELYLGSRKEIEVYKILRKISEAKNIKLKKEQNGFYIGENYIRVLDNGKIKLNNKDINLFDINYIYGKL